MGSKISYLTFVMIFLYKDSVVQWYSEREILSHTLRVIAMETKLSMAQWKSIGARIQ